MEALADALGLNLHLEDSEEGHTEGSVRGGESERGRVDPDIEESSSGEQQLVQQQLVEQQLVEQADGLNSFARQLEEQLTSCHREKPLDLEDNQPLHPELEDDNEMAPVEQTEKLLEKKELLGGNTCQECSAVLPSGLVL